MSDPTWVDIRYTKWLDVPHYAYRMRVVGEDDHGVWGVCDVGEPVHKGGELAFIRDSALLSLIPRQECWSALWFPPTELDFELYVDINSPPDWADGSVTMVDLDFDVVRRRDGTVELVDEDEFEAHRIVHGYPDEMVELARSAARDLTERVSLPSEPFDAAWRPWYSHCFR